MCLSGCEKIFKKWKWVWQANIRSHWLNYVEVKVNSMTPCLWYTQSKKVICDNKWMWLGVVVSLLGRHSGGPRLRSTLRPGCTISACYFCSALDLKTIKSGLDWISFQCNLKEKFSNSISDENLNFSLTLKKQFPSVEKKKF